LILLEHRSKLVKVASRKNGIEGFLVRAPFARTGFVQIIRVLSSLISEPSNGVLMLVDRIDEQLTDQ
jgi:hypothetical protein